MTKKMEKNYRAQRVLSILVAEDSPIIQTILLRILSGLGHKIVVVGNGLEAVGAVRSRDFDIVVMDMHMPEMDGPTAVRSIRGTPTDVAFTPIIACSVDTEKDKIESFFEAGVDAYIGKPIDTETLVRTINDVLDEKVHMLIAEDDRGNEMVPPESENNHISESDSDISAFLDSLKSIDE